MNQKRLDLILNNDLFSYFNIQKLRNVENRYKNEIEDLTRRYEQIKIEKDTLEKRLKEVDLQSLSSFF